MGARTILIIKPGDNSYSHMSAPPGKKEQPSLIDRWKKSDNKIIAAARELLWVLVVVGAIALTLFLVSGTWPAVVTIESESMVPNMNVGDLVFVVQKDRFGPLETWASGKDTGNMKFGDYGNVIVYRPNGAGEIHPIIHRARSWVEPGDTVSPITGQEVPPGNTSPMYTAQQSGYITKGDNNGVIDQVGWIEGYRGIGSLQPVKPEWVVGKALFVIPLLGYLPLNIVPVAIIIIVAMLLYEWYSSRKKSSREQTRKKRGKSGK